MKRLALALLVLPLIAAAQQSEPPYPAEVTVDVNPNGNPIDEMVLLLDGQEVGEVSVGTNTFPDLLPVDGTYTFEVATRNAAGEVMSDPVTVSTQAIGLPPKATITIRINCQACIVTEQ